MAEDKVAGAISEIRQFGMAHQTVGDGQCYALAGYYLWRTTGKDVSYSNGHTMAGLKGGGVNASDIWKDWDFGAGTVTKGAPVGPGDFKNGAVICIAPNVGAPMYTTGYGHVGVVTGISGSQIEITQQNYGATPGKCSIETYDVNALAGVTSGFVYPPGSGGETINNGGFGGDSQAPGQAANDYTVPAAQMIHVQEIVNFDTKDVEFPNPVAYVKNKVRQMLGGAHGWHWRFMHSDFMDIELMDFYGNSFSYQPELFSTNALISPNWTVRYVGSLGDYNNCKMFIVGYKNFMDYAYNVEHVINYPEYLNYALNDMISKDLTIINDATATYLQSNKNQMLAQKTSFNENAKMLKKQIALSNKQVDFQNDQSAYSANYAVQMAKAQDERLGAHQTTGLINDGAGLLGDLFSLNFGGAIKRGVGMGTSIYNNQFDSNISQMGIANAKKMKGFTARGNKLNKQANNLSNMQAKLALKQAKRAFKAQLKDIENQPDAIQQQGADLSFPAGNNLTGLYVMVHIPLEKQLKLILQTINNDGCVAGVYMTNIVEMIRDQLGENGRARRALYLKTGEIENNLPIPASLSAAFNAIFQTGTRIWWWIDRGSQQEDRVGISGGMEPPKIFPVITDNYDDYYIQIWGKEFLKNTKWYKENATDEEKKESEEFLKILLSSSNADKLHEDENKGTDKYKNAQEDDG